MTNNQQEEIYNRIKVVLVEQGKTIRWLAEQIHKCENTVCGFSYSNNPN